MFNKAPKFKTTTKYSLMTAIWLINPVFVGGCQETKGFEFGEQEMLDLMETVNDQDWTLQNADGDYTLEFDLIQAAEEQASLNVMKFVSSAHACGERSFVSSANACIDSSRLVIEGTVTIIDTETEEVVVENRPVEGEMAVDGLQLNNAALYLSFDSGSIDFQSNDGLSFELGSASWE